MCIDPQAAYCVIVCVHVCGPTQNGGTDGVDIDWGEADAGGHATIQLVADSTADVSPASGKPHWIMFTMIHHTLVGFRAVSLLNILVCKYFELEKYLFRMLRC